MGMNFEESLEKLKERHEALTQTVEIIAAMQKDNDRRFGESTAEWDRRMGQVLEAITQLGHHRLDNLEGNSH
jgi:hypothetical protein